MLSLHPVGRCMILTCPITSDFYIDYVIKVLSAGFALVKFLFFPL